jgi:20S proteasome alpha/beta subunit
VLSSAYRGPPLKSDWAAGEFADGHRAAPHHTVTLLVSLHGTDGLALAADSRGTFGDPRGVTAQNDAQQKAHILSPHVAVLAAGSGEIGSLVIKDVKEKVSAATIDGVSAVMNVLRDTVRESYQNWFTSVPAMVAPALAQTGQVATRPDLSFLVAGYEPDNVTAHMFSLPSLTDYAPMLHNYGFAVQGVAQYALYLLNRLYEADRSVEELTALAVYVITETASQDGKVGGPVNVITITPSDGCEALDQRTVSDIRNSNESRSKALRDSFYKRDGEGTVEHSPTTGEKSKGPNDGSEQPTIGAGEADGTAGN